MKITLQQATDACTLHKNNNTLNVATLQQILGNVSLTFGQIAYVTKVQTAAAHKALDIQKVTIANVILCNNIAAQTSVYSNRVKKSAKAIASNDMQAVEQFVPSETYFEHTNTHCIVQHKVHTDKQYLYAIFNNAQSVYMHNGSLVDKAYIAQYLTPSAVKELYKDTDIVHNKTNDIKHNICVRVIALSNIVSIKARKQLLLK